MLEWYEKQIERLIRRVHFWLISRLYPELSCIPDEKHRGWALWYSGGSEGQPGWKRHLRWSVMFAGGPLAIILAVAMLVSMRGRVPAWMWVLVVLAGWIAGFVGSLTMFELSRKRKAQKKNFRALRIFGYDVCMTCGYDMQGHELQAAEIRRCPECGQGVPPMQGAVPHP